MGWSSTSKASETLARIERAAKATREGTDETSSNVILSRGTRYFYEVIRQDQSDGGIRGEIYRYVSETHARLAGEFYIDGEGWLVEAPRFFRRLADEQTR